MNWLREFMFPPVGSDFAQLHDDTYMAITYICVFFFAIVAGVIAISLIWFRRKSDHDVTPHITHNNTLEIVWTTIPLLILMVLFFVGFHGYMQAFVPPGESLEIQVTAKKWQWTFEYPDGLRSLNSVHVPVNKPVKFVMTSEDVLHDFFLKDFRTKFDVIPGRYTQVWFTPKKPGVYFVQCAQYCGKGHSDMIAKVSVDDEATYEKWLVEGDEELKTMPLPELGKLVYENRGCSTCHNLDGTRSQGPSWKGIWGKMESLADGKTVLVDENYVRESMMDPQAKVVKGFEPVMPTYQGLLRPREVTGVIEFIKSLK